MADWQKILVAVDDSNLAGRVVEYVGQVVSGHAGVQISLLQVYPEPPPCFYQEGHSLKEFKRAKEEVAHKVFQRLVPVLVEHGIARDAIQTLCQMVAGTSLSKEILKVREQGAFGTLVLGRRGISKAEEFIFGSISTAILRESHDFAVWVVA